MKASEVDFGTLKQSRRILLHMGGGRMVTRRVGLERDISLFEMSKSP